MKVPGTSEGILQADPPPSNSDYNGDIIRIILGSSYIPIIPLLQGEGSSQGIL